MPQGAETSSGMWRWWVPSLRALSGLVPAMPHEHWGRSAPESNKPLLTFIWSRCLEPTFSSLPARDPDIFRRLSSWRLPAKIAAGGAGRGKGRSSGTEAGPGGRLWTALTPAGRRGRGTQALRSSRYASSSPASPHTEILVIGTNTHFYLRSQYFFDAADASISLWKTLALLLRKNHLALQCEPGKDSDALRCHMNREARKSKSTGSLYLGPPVPYNPTTRKLRSMATTLPSS